MASKYYKLDDAQSSFSLTYKPPSKKIQGGDDDSDDGNDDYYLGEHQDEGSGFCFDQGTMKKETAAAALDSATAASGRRAADPPHCQVENCGFDLTSERYYRRHKVCQVHAKAEAVTVAGTTQRFCQQCSRFHELTEFDKAKRSCRRRLAGHNERRRKFSCETQGEAATLKQPSPPVKDVQHRQQANKTGGSALPVKSSSNKHFRIR